MFRNQIIAVVVTAALIVGWATVTGSFVPLAGFALLLPICGAFLLIDHHLVERWRAELLQSWSAGAVEFEAYRAAVRASPVLPKATLEGMLATLPSEGTLSEEQAIGTAARQAIAVRLLAKHHAERRALAVKTAAGTLAACLIVIAVVSGRWEPLLGLTAVPLIAWLGRPTVPPAH
jgi:hypothetical protein